jgi:hypothetical protein
MIPYRSTQHNFLSSHIVIVTVTVTIAITVCQELATLCMHLFVSVKAKNVGASSAKAHRSAAIGITALRSLLRAWKLVDGVKLQLCDVEIIFSQLGTPTVRSYEIRAMPTN